MEVAASLLWRRSTRKVPAQLLLWVPPSEGVGKLMTWDEVGPILDLFFPSICISASIGEEEGTCAIHTDPANTTKFTVLRLFCLFVWFVFVVVAFLTQ